MPRFKYSSHSFRYALERDSLHEPGDHSPVDSEEEDEDDAGRGEITVYDATPLDFVIEGDSVYALFDRPVRIHAGLHIKKIYFMRLYVDRPVRTAQPSLSPIFRNIRPGGHGAALKYGWSKTFSPGFHVMRDKTVAIRDSVVGVTNAASSRVGFKRGAHQWIITWDAKQRGIHPVIGVGTRRARLQSDRYEPLVGGDGESYGWHLDQHCLLHDVKNGAAPLPAYPGTEYRRRGNYFFVPNKIAVFLDMEEGTLGFMIHNPATGSQFLGVAFTGLKGKELFPMISTTWGKAKVQIDYVGGFYPRPDTLMQQSARKIPQEVLDQLNDLYLFPADFKKL